MLARTLSNYLKKVSGFALENGSVDFQKNVQIIGDDNFVKFSCNDGSSGIEQIVDQDKEFPLTGSFCINVFKFAKIISQLHKSSNLKIITERNKIKIIENDNTVSLEIFDEDQYYKFPKTSVWSKISDTFLKNLDSIIPPADDEEHPIFYDKEQMYFANVRAFYHIYETGFSHSFCLDLKNAKKIFVDKFDKASITDGILLFKNDKCKIFVNQFNGTPIFIKPVLEKIKNLYIMECLISVEELRYVYSIIKNLSDINENAQKKAVIMLDRNWIDIIFNNDTKLSIKNFEYKHNNRFTLNVPIVHLNRVLKPSFTKGNDKIKIKLALDTQAFIAESDGLVFTGGLYAK